MNEYDDGIDWSQVPDTCTQHENLAQENVHPPCSQFQNNYPDGSSNYDLQQHSRGGASTIETITNNQNEAGWMKEEIRRLKTQLEAKNEEAFDLRVSLCACFSLFILCSTIIFVHPILCLILISPCRLIFCLLCFTILQRLLKVKHV
mmetsp:Transcript_10181/g.15272  ORF Transcript_10181/g.15272 Transcript_10181/m.15272 type:complete len:147 (+) Transcript_10181:485-925(+)